MSAEQLHAGKTRESAVESYGPFAAVLNTDLVDNSVSEVAMRTPQCRPQEVF
jgi:hypothetical protein